MLKTKNVLFVLAVVAFVSLVNLTFATAQATAPINTGLTPAAYSDVIIKIVFLVVVNAIFGIAALFFAKTRNLNPFLGFLIGFLFSLLGLLIILIMPKQQKPEAKS